MEWRMEKTPGTREAHSVTAEIGDLGPFNAECVLLLAIIRLVQPNTVNACAEFASI
jgi:hypothetical protein